MTVPTYVSLYNSVLSDLRSKLNINSIIGKVALNAVALVQAAKLKIYYSYLAFVYKNIFPDTADPESLGGSLNRFGYMKLNRYPFSATAGEYTIQVTGEIGGTLPVNTTFKSLDTSSSPDKLFNLDSTVILAAETENIQVRALDLGTQADLQVGDELQVTQPIANVNSYASVISIDTEAQDAETTEVYKQKVSEAYKEEPQGGSKTDIRAWSKDAQGVRTSYPYVNSPGIIDNYVEANPDDSTDGYGTPAQSILDEVEEVVEFDPDDTRPLDERGRRSMGIFQINYLPIDLLTVEVDIVGLTDVTFETAIETAIVAYLFEIRPFVDGADDPNDELKGYFYSVDIYGIVRDIIGNDARFTSLSVEIDSTPVEIYQFTDGYIPYLSSLTLS